MELKYCKLCTSLFAVRYVPGDRDNNLPPANGKHRKNSKSKTIEFKNSNYKDNSHSLSSAERQTLTIQNSRGGVTLLYDQQNQALLNGDLVNANPQSIPLRHSYNSNDMNAIVPGAVGMGQQPPRIGRDTDSFITGIYIVQHFLFLHAFVLPCI